MPPRRNRGGLRRSTRRTQPPRRLQGSVAPVAPVAQPTPTRRRTATPQRTPAAQPQVVATVDPVPEAPEASLTRQDIAQQVSQGIQEGMQKVLDALDQRLAGINSDLPVHTPPTHVNNIEMSPQGDIEIASLTEERPAAEVASSFMVPMVPKTTNQFSLAKPIHAQISMKLRQKIWAGEYIDFSLLLNKEDRNVQLGTFDTGEEVPQLVWRQTKQKQLSLNEWTDGFHLFMSLILVKEPNEASNLLKYNNLVRGIAQEGGDWRYYDESFRRMKASEALAWDEVDTIALNFATSRGARNQNKGNSNQSVGNRPFRGRGRGNRPTIKRGFCFKFNRGQPCGGCAYKHMCSICSGSHAQPQCDNTEQGGDQSPQFQSSPSRPQARRGARGAHSGPRR